MHSKKALLYLCGITQKSEMLLAHQKQERSGSVQLMINRFIVGIEGRYNTTSSSSWVTEFRITYHYSQQVMITNEHSAHVTHRGNSDNKQTISTGHLVIKCTGECLTRVMKLAHNYINSGLLP